MATMTSELVVRLRDLASAPARAVANSMARLRQAQKSNAQQMQAMRGRMLDATAAAYVAARAISAPIRSAVEFESAMADVRKVVNFESPAAFKQMGKDVIDMSTRLPMAATGIAAIVAAAGQAGMQGPELLQFAEMATKVGVAFDMTADQTGTALANMKTALGLTVEQTGEVADVINHLSNNMASTAPALIDYMSRVGAAGNLYGFTTEQTAALGSAMIATGAEANVAATSLRAVGRALTRGASATKAQRKAFKLLGLDSVKVSKEMQKNGSVMLREVIARIGELPEHMRAATLSDLFGDEARAIAPLITNMELYDQAMANVADKAKYLGSTQKEYEQRAKTTAHNLQLLRNKVEAVAIAIGGALLPAVNGIADAIGPTILAIADFADKHPQVVQAVVAITAALVATRIATTATKFAFLFLKGGMLDLVGILPRVATLILGLLNPLALVRASMIALRAATVSTGIGAVIVAIAMAGLWIYENWEGLVEFFKGFGEGLMEGLAPVMPAIQPIIDAGKSLFNIISGMVGPIGATNSEWKDWGKTVGGVVAEAIKKVVGLIQGMVDLIMKAVDAAKEFGGAIASFWGGDNSGQKAPSAVQGRRAARGARPPAVAGARAAGGAVRRGLSYLTGEKGFELFTAPADGYVHNHSDTKAMLRSGGGNSVATMGGQRGGLTVRFGDIILQNVQDAEAVAREIGQRLRTELAGIHADTEWSTS